MAKFGLPDQQFPVIYADPPWRFETFSPLGRDRCADQHYSCMSLTDLHALPVQTLAAKDSVLLVWIIDSLLPEGLELIRSWGFVYKTVGFTWAKTTQDGTRPVIGTGYYTRKNSERCYLATRGHPKRLDKGVPELVISPRYRHSQKPTEVYRRIERLFAPPYLELFARPRLLRPDWTYWGNEVRGEDAA